MSDEKTEEPTQKKIDEAREKGQVGQSPDFNKLLIAAAVLQVLLSMVDYGVTQLKSTINHALTFVNLPFHLAIKEVTKQSSEVLIILIGITLAPAVLMRLAGTWSQFGLLLAPKAIMPDLNKLNPVNAAKQMFSKQKLTDLLLNVLKAVIIVLALILVVKPALGLLFLIPQTDLQQMVLVTNALLTELTHKTLGMLLVIAAADFFLKKHFHKKNLMMSKEDIKQEFKQSQGDPHVKGQRKQMARQIANEAGKNKEKARKKPDAVVVNPTHYAVALHYRPGDTPLPQILEHGEDDDAKALIQYAHENRVPVIRCVWLARRLVTLEPGSFIPRDSLKTVAEIYHVLHELEEVIAGEVIPVESIH